MPSVSLRNRGTGADGVGPQGVVLLYSSGSWSSAFYLLFSLSSLIAAEVRLELRQQEASVMLVMVLLVNSLGFGVSCFHLSV